jgi:hypothetical protein
MPIWRPPPQIPVRPAKLPIIPAVAGWANISKVNGVAVAAIAKVNGVAVAAISKFNGVAV